MDDQPNFVTSPFDVIRHQDREHEFWRARELYRLLGYNRWENFEKVIAKAKVACKYNGRDVEENFSETTKTRRVGSKGGKTEIRDVELTRYACYMVVLSSDSSKPLVGLAKDYFAEQTRRQELSDTELFAQLSEDEKRLIYRTQLSLYNRKLAQTAHEAGVVTHPDHADFVNAGYSGLYGGLTEDDIHALKKLVPGEEISNWMSSEELADNIFRAAQTDATMRREHTRGKEQANSTHFAVGRKVREFIINELGNTPPEQLPTPRKSIRHLQIEEEKRLKQGPQLSLFEDEQKNARHE